MKTMFRRLAIVLIPIIMRRLARRGRR